ncbi:ribonuclease III [Furfurilactobacillus siliginis]|uniref:Ribonuclease 3 n=1 Tax=Furfurilactobacillus siliginis TaxID=348151 RepID=A0A0R2L563_9LACO|nr:ribonuclease III [Furfurilactobacillus siliginis]KRN96904.1 ribonuclease III [Furfurilactobacillus siliginis]GEK28100.1 ribonuclease 3 [Furfurilactobacillus siliginis]
MIPGIQKELADRFDIHFSNPALLDEAFTQASYVNEHPREDLKFYERIEFLGDAVLQLTVSEYIYKRYPEMPQGKLTRLRAAMVQEASFAKFALECHFDQYIRLGKGEEKEGARHRASLLCDIFESFVGALYLDKGKDAVVAFITTVIFPKLDAGWFDHAIDYKTALQEWLQRDGDVLIDYELAHEDGPENDRSFTMTVAADGTIVGQGTGKSKKSAEQAAALKALNELRGQQETLITHGKD